MDILHKHTSAFFGRKQQIQRSGKLLYSAGKIRRESERMGVYCDGKIQRFTVNYSAARKAGLSVINRVLNR